MTNYNTWEWRINMIRINNSTGMLSKDMWTRWKPLPIEFTHTHLLHCILSNTCSLISLQQFNWRNSQIMHKPWPLNRSNTDDSCQSGDAPPTCVLSLSAELCCQGATLPGNWKKMESAFTISSEMKVTLMRTVAPGGRFPTLMVNTSWRGAQLGHHQKWPITLTDIKCPNFSKLSGVQISKLQHQLNIITLYVWSCSFNIMLSL